MRNPVPPCAAMFSGLLLLASASAQALQLDVTGGSLPGTVVADAHPGVVADDIVLIVPSLTTGPIPLALLDPTDPRSLDVGLELNTIWGGLVAIGGHFTVNLPLAADPTLVDVPLYFQSLTVVWTPTLFGRLSNTNVVRFAAAGAFRDRFVTSTKERAFATVLPRADRKWLLAGGGRGLLLAQVADQTTEIYDPWTDSFAYGPTMTTPRSLHTATALPNGRWLLTGGVGTNNDPQALCEIYDPVLDTFTASAPMTIPRMGHTATLLPNGKVFVSGGLRALTVTPTQLSAVHDATALTEVYDPATDTWTPGPNLTTPRAGHMAILRPNGTVVLAGGISYDTVPVIGWLPTVRRSCDVYDPAAGTMVVAPQMTRARSMIDPVPIGGNRWLLAGGIGGLSLSNLGTPTNTAEIYDAVANSWTAVGSMATARGNHKAWSLGGGQFLFTGGADGTILNPTALASTEVFSTATNTFAPGPTMNFARAGAAAFATPQGQVQLFGGASAGGTITNSTEWYYF